MQVLRSMLAILLGYGIFGLSSRLLVPLGIDPSHPGSFVTMLLGVVLSALVAFAAGYAAGWIAGQKALIHALSISILLTFGAGMSLILGGAKWGIFSTFFVSIPMTFAGALAVSKRLPSEVAETPKPEDPLQDVDELLKD